MHPIKQHILMTLSQHTSLVFGQLCPHEIPSSKGNYHLQKLLEDGYVKKIDKSYSLTPKGLAHLENHNKKESPKVVVMIVIEDSKGRAFLIQHTKQPFISQWSVPQGEIELDDHGILEGAARIMRRTIGASSERVHHVGNCYLKFQDEGILFSWVFAHICHVYWENTSLKNGQWHNKDMVLAPGISDIIASAKRQAKYRHYLKTHRIFS
jgi:ADP-ribose pyrophosphatase YjhB (NUDIX family)